MSNSGVAYLSDRTIERLGDAGVQHSSQCERLSTRKAMPRLSKPPPPKKDKFHRLPNEILSLIFEFVMGIDSTPYGLESKLTNLKHGVELLGVSKRFLVVTSELVKTAGLVRLPHCVDATYSPFVNGLRMLGMMPKVQNVQFDSFLEFRWADDQVTSDCREIIAMIPEQVRRLSIRCCGGSSSSPPSFLVQTMRDCLAMNCPLLEEIHWVSAFPGSFRALEGILSTDRTNIDGTGELDTGLEHGAADMIQLPAAGPLVPGFTALRKISIMNMVSSPRELSRLGTLLARGALPKLESLVIRVHWQSVWDSQHLDNDPPAEEPLLPANDAVEIAAVNLLAGLAAANAVVAVVVPNEDLLIDPPNTQNSQGGADQDQEDGIVSTSWQSPDGQQISYTTWDVFADAFNHFSGLKEFAFVGEILDAEANRIPRMDRFVKTICDQNRDTLECLFVDTGGRLKEDTEMPEEYGMKMDQLVHSMPQLKSCDMLFPGRLRREFGIGPTSRHGYLYHNLRKDHGFGRVVSRHNNFPHYEGINGLPSCSVYPDDI